MFQDRHDLRRRNAVGELGEVAVAGVGQRLSRGERNIALRMGTCQVPFPGLVGDVQVAPAKDRGLRQHFPLFKCGGEKQRLED